MKKIILAAAAILATAGIASAADNFSFRVSIGTMPTSPPVYETTRVVYQPPVYETERVVYQPAPVYDQSYQRVRVSPPDREWRVVEKVVYVNGRPVKRKVKTICRDDDRPAYGYERVAYQPRWQRYDDRRHWRHDRDDD